VKVTARPNMVKNNLYKLHLSDERFAVEDHVVFITCWGLKIQTFDMFERANS